MVRSSEGWWVSAAVGIILVLGVLFLGSQKFNDPTIADDSAGVDHTPIPFRRYDVGNRTVIAFELYGMKCVTVGVALDCEEVGR